MTTLRGLKGDYYLSRNPEEIFLSEVMRAVEESTELVFCTRSLKGRKKCRRESKCVAQAVWKETSRRIHEYLKSVSVAEMGKMAQQMGIEKQLDHRFMYYI